MLKKSGFILLVSLASIEAGVAEITEHVLSDGTVVKSMKTQPAQANPNAGSLQGGYTYPNGAPVIYVNPSTGYPPDHPPHGPDQRPPSVYVPSPDHVPYTEPMRGYGDAP